MGPSPPTRTHSHTRKLARPARIANSILATIAGPGPDPTLLGPAYLLPMVPR